MSLIDIENEIFRRDILQLLEQDSGYALTEMVLVRALAELGNPIPRARLRAQLHWLSNQSLVTLGDLAGSGLLTAKLTERGEEVALGVLRAEGVARLPL